MNKVDIIRTLDQLNKREQVKILDKISKYQEEDIEMQNLLVVMYVADIFMEYNLGNKERAEGMAVHSHNEDTNNKIPKILKGVIKDLYPESIVLK